MINNDNGNKGRMKNEKKNSQCMYGDAFTYNGFGMWRKVIGFRRRAGNRHRYCKWKLKDGVIHRTTDAGCG